VLFFSILAQIENEENVLICLRIIIELHKQFRPPISQEVSIFCLFHGKKRKVLWNHCAKWYRWSCHQPVFWRYTYPVMPESHSLWTIFLKSWINVFPLIVSSQIHHFLDFVKQIYKDLPKVVVSTTFIAAGVAQVSTGNGNMPPSSFSPVPMFPVFLLPTVSSCSHQARYFENPQVIAENTVPSPEMVGMITSVLVKTAPERDDSETRTVSGRQFEGGFISRLPTCTVLPVTTGWWQCTWLEKQPNCPQRVYWNITTASVKVWNLQMTNVLRRFQIINLVVRSSLL